MTPGSMVPGFEGEQAGQEETGERLAPTTKNSLHDLWGEKDMGLSSSRMVFDFPVAGAKDGRYR